MALASRNTAPVNYTQDMEHDLIVRLFSISEFEDVISESLYLIINDDK
jgi:hypothetical protein